MPSSIVFAQRLVLRTRPISPGVTQTMYRIYIFQLGIDKMGSKLEQNDFSVQYIKIILYKNKYINTTVVI